MLAKNFIEMNFKQYFEVRKKGQLKSTVYHTSFESNFVLLMAYDIFDMKHYFLF